MGFYENNILIYQAFEVGSNYVNIVKKKPRYIITIRKTFENSLQTISKKVFIY